MLGFSFTGTCEDGRGVAPVIWRIESPAAPERAGRYEVIAVIRGFRFRGCDVDGLQLDEGRDTPSPLFTFDSFGNLTECVLAGDMPCVIDGPDRRHGTMISFVLDLRQAANRDPSQRANLLLSIRRGSLDVVVRDEWFEDGMGLLGKALPPGEELICCSTCLFSDYSPAGQGLMGMRCHRDARDQYLAVRSKWDYFDVPVTEYVPETYLCPEYTRRVAGTGYRG